MGQGGVRPGGHERFACVVTGVPPELCLFPAVRVEAVGVADDSVTGVAPWDADAGVEIRGPSAWRSLTPEGRDAILAALPPVPRTPPPPRHPDWLPYAAELEARVRGLVRERGEDAARDILAAVADTLLRIDYQVPIEHTRSFRRTCKHLIEGAADWLRRAPALAAEPAPAAPARPTQQFF